MVTIKDLAAAAGVSPATVSRSLNNSPLISQETRQRVQAIAKELGYSKNAVAQGLSRGKLAVLGLVISDITNPFYAEVARGVEDVAQRHGFGVILCNTDEDLDKEAYYARFLWTHRVSGVILASSTLRDPIIQQMQQKIPVVLLSRIIQDHQVSYVACDDLAGGYLATEHLIKLGHRHIAFIGEPVEVAPSWLRFQGYQQALKTYKLPYFKKWARFGTFNIQAGRTIMRAYLRAKHRPTAVFAANDLIALGAMQAAEEAGLTVPDDLAVVGYDDIPVGALPQIQLTTVAQPLYLMGKLAAAALLKIMEQPEAAPVQQVLRPTLVVRRSCGAQRAADG